MSDVRLAPAARHVDAQWHSPPPAWAPPPLRSLLYPYSWLSVILHAVSLVALTREKHIWPTLTVVHSRPVGPAVHCLSGA